MTRRLIVLASLSACFAFGADPALLKLLPPDAKMIAGIDAEQARNSPFGQYLLTHHGDGDPGFARFISTTGFDPRRDLREVVFASLPSGKNGMFAAKGAFNISKVLAAAQLDGGQTLIYQGFNVVTGKPGKDNGWVAFLDGATAVGGDSEAVKAAIARRQSSTGLGAALTAKLNSLSGRYDAWMYTLTPGTSFAGKLPNNQSSGDVFQGVELATGGVKFGASVIVDAEAVVRSEKDATALQDVLRFLAGMVQLNREKPGAEDLATVLESLQIKTSANLVSVSLEIPQAQIEKMIESRRTVAKRRSRPVVI